MDLNPINKPKRKRIVNKEEWTKEKRKRLRIAGKEYVNAKGELVTEKQPGADCKCRRRCYDKVPKATRMKLFKGYYSLKSHDEQNAYLFGLIRKVPIARKRAEGSTRRTCTFNYYIRVGGQETQVCVKALANIHGVGKSKIHILCEKLGQNVLFPRDERGRHSKMPKKVTDDTVDLVKQHIYSILHSERARDFLKDEKANNGPDVNITQMHKDFLDNYDPEFAGELHSYDKSVNHENQSYNDTYLTTIATDFRQEYMDAGELKVTQVSQPIEVMVDAEGNTHQVVNAVTPTMQNVVIAVHQQPRVSSLSSQGRKRRKTTRDGRPEPLIRQWYYSKIFHDLYSTKEAISLRKKIISWKSTEDFLSVKPVRKQRSQKKLLVGQQVLQQHVVTQVDMSQHQQTMEQPQIHLIQARLSKGTNTVPIPISTQTLSPKKIVHEVQLQNVPIKKKPVQVFQTQTGQDMYSIYPMILQDLSQLETVNLAHAQNIQQAQLRTIAPTHFQAVGQPTGNTMAITTSNLQPLSLNINLSPNGTHYTTTQHGIMSYKFE